MPSASRSPDEASLLYVIGRVNQGVRREMQARLTDRGLSVQEYTALSVLRSRPGLSNAQLARRSLVAPQSMIETMAKLEGRGLVRREVDPEHARILRAAPTAKGLRLLDRVDPSIAAIEEQMLAGISPADRRVVLAALRGAMSRLSPGLSLRDPGAGPRSA